MDGIGGEALQEVNVSALERTSPGERLAGGLLYLLSRRPVQRGLRRFFPIVRLPGGFVVVMRYDDVSEVLTRDDVFEVVEERVRALNQGEGFLLGLQDGPAYQAYRKLVTSVFRLEDIEPRVARASAAHAERIVARAEGRLNAAFDLVTQVAIELCREYYGVPIPQVSDREFARWMFLLSQWLFDPREPSKLESAARPVIPLLNALVGKAIADEQRCPGARGDTIVARLVQRQRAAGGQDISDAQLRAVVIGMITGFVPTNSMAGGHILQVLLDREDAMHAARAAALDSDDERLERCLFEAMRFEALLREPLRIANQDYTLAEGSSRAKRIRRGSRVIASARSAMFDELHVHDPERFDPERPGHHSLVFGHGLHRCIGAAIAKAQITHTLKPLLRRERLRRARGRDGKLERLGAFPTRLVVTFDA